MFSHENDYSTRTDNVEGSAQVGADGYKKTAEESDRVGETKVKERGRKRDRDRELKDAPSNAAWYSSSCFLLRVFR